MAAGTLNETGSRVARIISLSWFVSFTVYMGTCAVYRPFGFEAIEASRFGFLATSLICLGTLAGVLTILFRAKPGASTALLCVSSAIASAVLLSILMVMFYAP